MALWSLSFPRGLKRKAETDHGGDALARDGWHFVLDDPELILTTFEAGGIDLPIDYEHQNDTPKAKLAGPIPAAGWIKELASRADGIWGRVEWTDRARTMIAAREYRFLSPSLLVEKTTGSVVRIKGAGLVHNPALHTTALAAQEDTMTAPAAFMARHAQLLGLGEGSSEEDVIGALETLLKDGGKPDPSKYAPVEALREAMASRNHELATFREDRARQKVQEAWDAGYLTTGSRDWALELCMKDEASFDAFVASTPPAFGHLTKPHTFPVTRPGGKPEVPAEVQLLSEPLGVSPERLTGG